jgi:hypothetical protein
LQAGEESARVELVRGWEPGLQRIVEVTQLTLSILP